MPSVGCLGLSWVSGGQVGPRGAAGLAGERVLSVGQHESEMLRSHPGEVLRRQLHIGDRSMEEKLAGGG